MIGRITRDGAAVAQMTDAGDWEPAAPEYASTAALLNATCHPLRNDACGDHHLPFGVMAMNRAAAGLGCRVELDKPIPPLPEGAVS